MAREFANRLSRLSPVGVGSVLDLLILALLVSACGSGSTSLVGPTTQKCQISVNGFTGSFGPSGGTGSVNVEAARECTWSASTPTAWITLPSSPQGQGAGTLNFNVQPNQVPAARNGMLEVNGQRLSVSQEPAPCRFDLSAGGQRLPAAGGSGSVNVAAVEGCSWTAASPVPWVSIIAGGSGSGPGTVRYAVTANPGPDRSAVLTIAGHPYTVDQDPAPAPTPTPPGPTPTPTPPPPGCDYAVAPDSLSFAATGGEATVRVSTTGACSWEVTSVAVWLRVSPDRGTGPASVTVAADPNPSSIRTSALNIGGQLVSVTQSAVAPTVVQLSGELRNPQGDCPNRRFTVNGTLVVASVSTQYVGSSSCADLKNKVQVFVEGLQGPDGTVAATRIEIRANDD